MKKINLILSLLLAFVFVLSSCSGESEEEKLNALYEELILKPSSEITLDSNTAVKAMRNVLWEEFREVERRDEARVSEITQKAIDFGEVTMKFEITIKGKAGPEGYPLYIALHGGGGAPKEVNDQQWDHMKIYYLDSVENGIYVAPRGVRDTWHTHFNDESYPLYERLIEDLSIYYGIDTNKVYLVGYSAGGDGVWQITPRLADRFSAVNMSAGHPNGVDLTNVYNTPFQIQCGQNDDAVKTRNTECARYCEVLDDLQETYGGGYIHNVYMHILKEHGIVDNSPTHEIQAVLANPIQWFYGERVVPTSADTNAIGFVSQYQRDPVPEKVVWNVGYRASLSDTESFYWLRAAKTVTEGIVVASYDKETNTVTIEQNTANGPISVMLNDEMVDLFKPVTVIVNGEAKEYNVTPSVEYMQKTLSERCDRNMIFAAEIVID